MAARWFRRLAVIGALALAVVLGMLPVSQAASGGVQLEPIGDPTWEPVDCHVFSAPIGTAETGYAEFLETAGRLLPPPNHVQGLPGLAIGPGTAHPPPYDSELEAGVDSLSFHEGHAFVRSEFSDGSGVVLVCMVVPDPGTTGSSPDFAAGPIIPNTIFPIHVEGVANRDGNPFDPFLTFFDVPPLTTAIDPSFNVEGHSHFPIFVATNQDFGPSGEDLRGNYEYVLTMTDAAGNGWTVRAHFVISR
jgi:hypothetical protein